MIERNGQYIFGTVKIGSKGQIVIPKDARDVFGVKEGDSLLLIGDVNKGNKGLVLLTADRFEEFSKLLFNSEVQK